MDSTISSAVGQIERLVNTPSASVRGSQFSTLQKMLAADIFFGNIGVMPERLELLADYYLPSLMARCNNSAQQQLLAAGLSHAFGWQKGNPICRITVMDKFFKDVLGNGWAPANHFGGSNAIEVNNYDPAILIALSRLVQDEPILSFSADVLTDLLLFLEEHKADDQLKNRMFRTVLRELNSKEYKKVKDLLKAKGKEHLLDNMVSKAPDSRAEAENEEGQFPSNLFDPQHPFLSITRFIQIGSFLNAKAQDQFLATVRNFFSDAIASRFQQSWNGVDNEEELLKLRATFAKASLPSLLKLHQGVQRKHLLINIQYVANVRFLLPAPSERLSLLFVCYSNPPSVQIGWVGEKEAEGSKLELAKAASEESEKGYMGQPMVCINHTRPLFIFGDFLPPTKEDIKGIIALSKEHRMLSWLKIAQTKTRQTNDPSIKGLLNDAISELSEQAIDTFLD